MWFPIAVLTALLWGVGQVLAKRGLAGTSPLFNNALAAGFALLFGAPLALAGGVTWAVLPITFLWSLLIAAGYQVYFYALARGRVALTGTVIALYPLVTAALSIAFLGERLTVAQGAAIVLAIGGTVILALPEKVADQVAAGRGWLVWGAVAAVVFGTADFGAKVVLTWSDFPTYLLALIGAQLVAVAVLSRIDRAGLRWPSGPRRALAPTLLGVAALQLGTITFTLSLSLGPASLVAPISSSYVGLTALLAVLFLGERLNRRQTAGVALVVLGIVLLGLGQLKSGSSLRESSDRYGYFGGPNKLVI